MTTEKPDVDLDSQSSESFGDREMLSVLSGSTTSLVPPTTEGVGAADAASASATAPTLTADEASGYAGSDAEGSSSEPVSHSEDDVSQSFSQSDSAQAES